MTFRNFLKQVANEDSSSESKFACEVFGRRAWQRGTSIDACFDDIWADLTAHARVSFFNCVERYLKLTNTAAPRWFNVYRANIGLANDLAHIDDSVRYSTDDDYIIRKG